MSRLRRDAAILFRNAGYECSHVSEVGLKQAEDEDSWHSPAICTWS
jgi:predicted nuclease of predicted toxin-antitoxin system